MSTDDFIQALSSNKLRIDAIEMELVQDVAKKPHTFRGKGYVEQDPEGALQFKLYAAELDNVDFKGHLTRTSQTVPGALFADDEYYSLRFRSFDGDEWTADRVRTSTRWPANGPPLLSGSLGRIVRSTKTRQQGHFVQIHFFDAVELPVLPTAPGDQAIGASKFQAAGCEISVRQHHDQVVIRAKSDSALDERMGQRLQEALKFLTGKPLWNSVEMRGCPGEWRMELSHRGRPPPLTRLDPPIGRSTIKYFEHGWILFSRYLEYLLANTPHPHWNHITYFLHNASEASSGTIDTWALGVASAVEGISSLLPNPISAGDQRDVEDLRQAVTRAIEGQPRLDRYLPRIHGLLGMLLNARPQDRLQALVRDGCATNEYVGAWKKLRDRQAHPTINNMADASANRFQERFDLINMTTTLMYQIIFHIVGYVGSYSDYGTRGYPTKQYPIRTEEDGQLT